MGKIHNKSLFSSPSLFGEERYDEPNSTGETRKVMSLGPQGAGEEGDRTQSPGSEGRDNDDKRPICVKVEPLRPKLKHVSVISKYVFSNLKNKFYFSTKPVSIQF